MAQDPKGVAFGQGNRGYATILNTDTSGFLDAVNRVGLNAAEAGRKAAAAKAKEQDDMMKMIKPYDKFSKFESDIDQKYLPMLIQGVQDGTLGRGDIVEITAKYKNEKNAAKDIQDRVLKGASLLNADEDVIGGDEIVQLQLAGISTEDLSDYVSGVKTFDSYNFLNQDGGSRFLDENNVLKNFTKDQAEVSYSRTSDGKLKVNPDGYTTQDTFGKQLKLSNYVEYNDALKKIKVKDAKGLMDDGVVDIAKQDPKLRRILLDRTRSTIENMKKSGDFTDEYIEENIELIEANVFADLLEGREKGSVTKKFGRKVVDKPSKRSGGGMSDQEKQTFYENATGQNGQQGYTTAEGQFTGLKGSTSFTGQSGDKKNVSFEVNNAVYKSGNDAFLRINLSEDLTSELFDADGKVNDVKFRVLRRGIMRDLGISENALIDKSKLYFPNQKGEGYSNMQDDLMNQQLEIHFNPNKLDKATFFKAEYGGRTYKVNEGGDPRVRVPGKTGENLGSSTNRLLKQQ